MLVGAALSTSLYLREQKANTRLLAAQGDLERSNAGLVKANALAEERRAEAENRLEQLGQSTQLMEQILGEPLPFEDGA